MHKVLLLGGGKIGQTIAELLAATKDYRLRVADIDSLALRRMRGAIDVETLAIDAARSDELAQAMRGCDSVISALGFRFNPAIAQVALDAGASYFDLTEDRETARCVRNAAAAAACGPGPAWDGLPIRPTPISGRCQRGGRPQIFMPQCGLAPGFIGILAYHLAKAFDSLDTVHMRVGALPQFPSNALNYNLTWSTDGLINEYCNPCEAIHEGRRIEALPLEGLEGFSLDGVRYEAFNTSGGLGTLCETLDGRVRELNYRTIRYVGHRDLMAFLVNDLRLGQRGSVLKDILEKAIPVTFQDVVVIFCVVTGWKDGQFVQISDARKIYPQTIASGGTARTRSAIQITTAAAVCAVLDLHLAGKLPASDNPLVPTFVKQEDVDYDDFIRNRFGRYFQSGHPATGGRDAAGIPGLDVKPAA